MKGARRLVVRGRVRVPGDKSVSHRALMLGALADGTSRVRGILCSADTESTAGALRSVGWDIPSLGESLSVAGGGLKRNPLPESELNCGNSGTTTRLLLGLLAGYPSTVTFTGDESLSRRPMRRVTVPLAAMGARFESIDGHDGLPLTMHGGGLQTLDWKMEKASAQVKSALLLGGVTGGVPVVLREPSPSRDHTERLLRAMGAAIDAGPGMIVLDPPTRLDPLDLTVPGDPSSAAFFACLAAMADGGSIVLADVGINPGRTGFIHVLRRMGARIEVVERDDGGPEPMGDLLVRPGHLGATVIQEDEVPSLIDELPVLACLAARASGDTVITGAGELRVKESDRIATVVANLRTLGVDVEERPDGMRIRGTGSALSGRVQTHGDHRIAMAFGILGSAPGSRIEIDDRQCVSVSYPDFWRDLESCIG